MPRAGIWARAIRVMSHICDLTRYFHTGRLTAQTQFFLNLSDRHPLGPEGRRQVLGRRGSYGMVQHIVFAEEHPRGGRRADGVDAGGDGGGGGQ